METKKVNYFWISIVLGILLIISIGYIGFNTYTNYILKEQVNAYQMGVQYGYEQAIIQLMQESVKCTAIPVTYNNSTINLIAVECLNTQNN